VTTAPVTAVQSSVAARLAPDGTGVAVIEVNRDMTAVGDAERYARSCLVEVSPDPLLAIGKAGTITDVNQATRPGGRRAGGANHRHRLRRYAEKSAAKAIPRSLPGRDILRRRTSRRR